ncbi:PilN domain-containing protein [Psychroflexus tropicus]|uniref:PilN domain-containing protein n=1 Tax=Psychroflexus tropicus TaxID=197345 RepID=UPI000380B52E|nr:PilN domain-containing protein [Psychroflexus tropicus]
MSGFDDKIKNFTKNSIFIGIEVLDTKDKASIYNYVELKQEGDELILADLQPELSFEELLKMIPKRSKVSLVINKSFVLTKRTESKKETDEQYINAAFPNTDLNSFYYDIHEESHSSFVSICRKNKIEDIVNEFKSQQIAVASLSFGNQIAIILKTIGVKYLVKSSNAKIDLSKVQTYIEKEVIDEPVTYNFEGIELSNENLLSFSAALNLYFKNYSSLTNYNDLMSEQESFFKHLNFNYYFPRISLGFIFIVLVINSLVFFNYSEKVSPLEVYAMTGSNQLNQLDELIVEVKKLEVITDKISNQEGDETIFYVNEIVKNMPDQLILSELTYQPISRSIKKGEDLSLAENLIKLKGKATTNNSLSDWLLTLESYDWIVDIVITDYKNQSSRGEFEIDLKLDIQ